MTTDFSEPVTIKYEVSRDMIRATIAYLLFRNSLEHGFYKIDRKTVKHHLEMLLCQHGLGLISGDFTTALSDDEMREFFIEANKEAKSLYPEHFGESQAQGVNYDI